MELTLAQRVGDAVAKRRKALGWTGVQLADRTAELGYPITRVAISKIETNSRAGKFDVAELLVLAEALYIPPVLLLAADFPTARSRRGQGTRSTARRCAVVLRCGAKLIRADALAAEWEERLSRMRKMLAAPNSTRGYRDQLEDDIAAAEAALVTLRADVQRQKDELWGGERVRTGDE